MIDVEQAFQYLAFAVAIGASIAVLAAMTKLRG